MVGLKPLPLGLQRGGVHKDFELRAGRAGGRGGGGS